MCYLLKNFRNFRNFCEVERHAEIFNIESKHNAAILNTRTRFNYVVDIKTHEIKIYVVNEKIKVEN